MRRGIPRGRRRSSPLRSAGGCLLLIASILILLIATRLFWGWVDQRRDPWAFEEAGRPTLTGRWIGTLVTGGAARRGIYLDLQYDPRPSHSRMRERNRSNLKGELRACGGSREQRFSVTGKNEDRTASRFRLALAVSDSNPPDGLAPSHLRGRWDGRDSLAFEVDMYLRRGQSVITSSDSPDTGQPARLALRRGDEGDFDALCARMQRDR